MNDSEGSSDKYEETLARLKAQRDASPADIGRLFDALTQLEAQIRLTHPREAHELADEVGKGFAWAAYHNGMGLALVMAHDALRAGFPLARATLEATQDYLYLALCGDYDLLGARAMASAVLDRAGSENAYLEYRGEMTRDEPSSAATVLSRHHPETTPDAEKDLDDLIGTMRFDPNTEARLRSAFSDILNDRNRRRFHWSGEKGGRTAMASKIATRVSWITQAQFVATYTRLSRWSHPAAQISPFRNFGYAAAFPIAVCTTCLGQCTDLLRMQHRFGEVGETRAP